MSFRACGLFFLFAISLVVAGCGGTETANRSNIPTANRSANANLPRTNAEELGLLIKLPYETEDIVWKERTMGGRSILAVLRFSTQNAEKIVSEAGAAQGNRSLTVETWFPEELVAQSEMSGDNALKGTSFPATAFFQEPFTTGTVTRVEGTDYFILELSAK